MIEDIGFPYKSEGEFTQDALSHFKMIIDKYNLKLVKESMLEVIFQSSKCGLSLIVLEYQGEWYVTFSFFIPPWKEGVTKEYMPDDTYESIYNKKSENWPTVNQRFDSSREKIKAELELIGEYIEKYFGQVLNGDFSWVNIGGCSPIHPLKSSLK